MRIEEGLKLDFKDVLFRPKRSTLKSRSEVSLEITHRFRNSGKTWTGVPVVAANMDTVGTFEMAIAFAQHKCLVCIHKHYTVEQWKVRLRRDARYGVDRAVALCRVGGHCCHAFDHALQLASCVRQV